MTKLTRALTIFTIFIDLSALLIAKMLLLFNRHRSKRKSKVEALLNERKDWPVATCDPLDCDCNCDPPDQLDDEYYEAWYDDGNDREV